MADAIYNYSLLVAWIILFTLGNSLLWAKTPKKEMYFSYNRSRRILGVALVLFGVQVLLQWIFEFRTSAPHIATAMNITIFYLEAILFGMAFISLLVPTYISRRQTRSGFSKWLVCMAVLWAATLGLEGTLRTAIQIVASAFFFWQACLIIRDFFIVYRQAVYKVDNYYADNVNVFVQWLYKSTLGIIAFGLTGAILAFTPKWCIAIQMTAGIFMFFYIYISFMNYALNYDTVEIAVAEPKNMAVPSEIMPSAKDGGQVQPYEQGNAYHRQIADSLDKWVADEGFRENGITIEQVAVIISSNRTYLSNFINSEFKCTFRTWINGHRIEYAKRLLAGSPEMTIDRIARESGFSSGNNFGKLFNESEKMPPSKWRKDQGE